MARFFCAELTNALPMWYSAPMATLGRKIAAARMEAGLDQAELGEALGVSGTAIGRYERDARRPSYEKLRAIADATKKPVEYFLTETGGTREVTINGVTVTGPAEKLADIIRRLQEDLPIERGDVQETARTPDQHTGIHELLHLHRTGRLAKEVGVELSPDEAAWLSRVNFSSRAIDTLARALELVMLRRTWDLQDRLHER